MPMIPLNVARWARIKRQRIAAGAPLAMVVAAFLWGGPASAGQFDSAATAADRGRCDSARQDPSAFKEPGDCMRISGYIAAGDKLAPAERVGAGSGPFGPLNQPGVVISVGAPMEPVMSATPGPERFFSADHGQSTR
jgi:hypothetical protein